MLHFKETVNTQWCNILHKINEDGSRFPSSCSPRHTNTDTQQNVCLFHSQKVMFTWADKKLPFIKQQTLSGQFACLSPYMANQSCGEILSSSIISSTETITENTTEIVCVPWKVWTYTRYCVPNLNSSTASQTSWPSFHRKEWKPKLQHVEVCFSR